MSIIATAPDNRLPVKTFVYSFNENLINEAIQRESLRNGQIYYLCNDLRLIEDRKQRLKSRFPGLKIDFELRIISATLTSVDRIGVFVHAHSTIACGPPSYLAATI